MMVQHYIMLLTTQSVLRLCETFLSLANCFRRTANKGRRNIALHSWMKRININIRSSVLTLKHRLVEDDICLCKGGGDKFA